MADLEQMPPYMILGVEPNATDERIRRAYQQMLLRCHPDYCKDKDASHYTDLIVQAYNTIRETRGKARDRVASDKAYETSEARSVDSEELKQHLRGMIDAAISRSDELRGKSKQIREKRKKIEDEQYYASLYF